MDVLMIGGTRFMGRIAVRKLLEQGDRVTVFSRGNVRPDWWDDVEHIQGDRTQLEDFKAKLKGKTFDAAIDTQAMVREHVESAVTALQGNLGRYLFVSSAAVYSKEGVYAEKRVQESDRNLFKETDVNWESLDYTRVEGEHPYAAGKRRAEKWLQESSTVPYTIIRLPQMLGEDDPQPQSWWWSQRALDGGPIIIPGEHRGMFRYLYATDAAEAFVRAIKTPSTTDQTYHIGSQEIITIEHWASMVIGAAGSESVLIFIPLDVIRKQEGLQHYIETERVSRSFSYIPDVSKAERDFGFTTTPVEQWVQSTVDWYRQHYKGKDAAGYEHRGEELILAEKWSEGFNKLVSSLTTRMC